MGQVSFSEQVEVDFGVPNVFGGNGFSFHAGVKEGVWHFVWASRADDDSDDELNFSIRQVHIPRYSFAAELELRFEFLDSISSDEISEDQVLIGDEFWPGFCVGVASDRSVMLVSTQGAIYPLESATSIALDDILRLRNARKAVVQEDGLFVLPEFRTNAGNPVSHIGRHLMEAIAFEHELHGELDPVNRFEIFSAFCTLVDSPLSRNLSRNYAARIILDQQGIAVEEIREDILELLLGIQEEMLPGTPVLGAGDDSTLDGQVAAVQAVLKSFSDAQRCQYVLLRDLHGALLLIGLAAVSGRIGFEEYCKAMTMEVAPDSRMEQTIRTQSAFIELLGLLV